MEYVFLVVFLLSPSILLVGLIKPNIFSKLIKKELTRRKILVFSICLAVISFIGLLFTIPPSKNTNQQAEITPVPTQNLTTVDSPAITATPNKQYNYEIIFKNENKTVENYMILIKPENRNDGEAIAMEIKKSCKKTCNISIYDDKRALELQKEYDEMISTLKTPQEDLEKWKQKNYIYVADHFVGYMSFESEEYQRYPYKDFYYEELKK
jgi:hypothetical protein